MCVFVSNLARTVVWERESLSIVNFYCYLFSLWGNLHKLREL